MSEPHDQPPTPDAPSGLGAIIAQMEALSPSHHIAQEAIAQDLIDDDCEEQEEPSSDSSSDEDSSDSSTIKPQYAMINGRRQSYVNPGARSTSLFSSSLPDRGFLSRKEKAAVREEERSLLRDNHILPPKHPRRGSEGGFGLGKRLSLSALRKVRSATDEEAAFEAFGPSEETSLLQGDRTLPYGGLDTPKTINKAWDEAVVSGKITTTWQREAKVLTKTSAPLILTFLLQYSLPVASVFTVGHIGKIELGAVSLASSESTHSTNHSYFC